MDLWAPFGSVKFERDEHYAFILVWTSIFATLFGCAKLSIRKVSTLIVGYRVGFLCTLN